MKLGHLVVGDGQIGTRNDCGGRETGVLKEPFLCMQDGKGWPALRLERNINSGIAAGRGRVYRCRVVGQFERLDHLQNI